MAEAVYSTKLVDDKRLRIDIAAINESLSSDEVSEIKWCPGKIHLAVCMTKRGATGYNMLNVFKEGWMPEDFILHLKLIRIKSTFHRQLTVYFWVSFMMTLIIH